MSDRGARPALIAPVVAAIVGAVIGFLVPTWLGPSQRDMQEAAAELVPESAAVTNETENTGSILIVGSYFAVVEFEAPGTTASQLFDDAIGNAEQLGWSISDEPTSFGAATISMAARDGLEAEIRAVASDTPVGSVQVARDEDALLRQRIVLVVIGAGLGILGAYGVRRITR
ncbi:MAG: hypothetical protein ACRDKT_14400 [Actinomycetota bacterium]